MPFVELPSGGNLSPLAGEEVPPKVPNIRLPTPLNEVSEWRGCFDDEGGGPKSDEVSGVVVGSPRLFRGVGMLELPLAGLGIVVEVIGRSGAAVTG